MKCGYCKGENSRAEGYEKNLKTDDELTFCCDDCAQKGKAAWQEILKKLGGTSCGGIVRIPAKRKRNSYYDSSEAEIQKLEGEQK